jgi:hypothetical protein
MPQLTFKLNSPTLAIREKNDQRTLVTLPGDVLVTLLAGDIDAKGFVQILYDNNALIMFAEDLRTRGLLVLKQSA